MKRLTPGFLEELRGRLAASRRRVLRSKKRRGAVLVPLMTVGGDECILFQRRAANISHASQISFPGGISEEGEESLETALRETHEEIGLGRERIEIVGALSDVYSKKGDVIRPHLAYIGDFASDLSVNEVCTLNPAEVVELYCMKIADFVDPKYVEDDILMHGNRSVAAKRYTKHKDRIIWGLSAVILEEVLNVLQKKI